MKNLLLISGILFLSILGVAFAQNITYLEPEECATIEVFNNTSNISTNYTFCALPAMRDFNISLSENISYVNSTVNVTFTCNPQSCPTCPLQPRDNCTVNKTLGIGEIYTNTGGACNLWFKSPDFNKTYNFTDTIQPKYGENFTWEKSEGQCVVSLNVMGLPKPEVEIPDGQKLVNIDMYDDLKKDAERSKNLEKETIDISKNLITTSMTLENIQKFHCNLSDDVLLNGYEKIRGKLAKKALEIWAAQNESKDSIQFAILIKEEDEEFGDANYRGVEYLELYSEIGFAEKTEEDVFYPKYAEAGAIPENKYRPLISTACLDKIEGLRNIKKETKKGSFLVGTILVIGGVMLVGTGVVLKSRWPTGPPF